MPAIQADKLCRLHCMATACTSVVAHTPGRVVIIPTLSKESETGAPQEPAGPGRGLLPVPLRSLSQAEYPEACSLSFPMPRTHLPQKPLQWTVVLGKHRLTGASGRSSPLAGRSEGPQDTSSPEAPTHS